MTSALPLLMLLLAAQPGEPAPVVHDQMFFAHDNVGGEQPELRRTDVIPLRAGQCYGWALRVEPEQRTVTIREVFELPGPGNWNTGDQISAVARNARTAVTQFAAPLAEGVITHSWCVAEGDPAGGHRIRVYHGETLLREFRFTVTPEIR